MNDVENWLLRVGRARRAAHSELSRVERSSSRVILLEDLTKLLSGEPIDVQDYFRESISCLENSLYRSAIVLAWAGQFHVLSEVCFEKHEIDIRSSRPKWKFRDLPELKEEVAESQFLVCAKDVGFLSKAQLRMLDGQLSQRNQCAHPTLYRPSMNVAIGYVDEMIRQTVSYLNRA